MAKTATATKSNKPFRPYALKRPCAHCPFRTDFDIDLRPGRVREISKAIQGGYEFPCHETTVDGEDDERAVGPDTKVCAGSLILQHKEGRPNQMMRIAERIGLLNSGELDLESPVFDSFEEWVRERGGEDVQTVTSDDGEVLEFEHCGVVADDCEDPAGYGGSGGMYDNDDPPTCNPLEDCCPVCGSLMCIACRATPNSTPGGARCVNCVEEED